MLFPASARSAVQVAGAVKGQSPSRQKEKPVEDSVELSGEAQALVDAELEPEEQRQVEELKQRDREVRSHEQAHAAAAGSYVRGGPNYEYQTGPDGNRYAVGGEVQIDTSPVPDDPEATIEKARVIRAAAHAPAEPSSQDRAVAAAAAQMEASARAQIIQQQQEEAAPSRETPEQSSHTSETGELPPSNKPFKKSVKTGVLLDAVA